jgi:diaminohydroxyphosphoribosylaminopyrimidine deaminase/5-amino-6-(5-phosphoribosylamino)uracil reductase
MKDVLQLAARGRGSVYPNPMVGALVIKDGRVIGRGYHAYYGGPHAEAAALNSCAESPRGATLYCNLEPCCFRHKNKHQPPCTERIMAEGIKTVVLSNLDPNPLVNGQGIKQLQESGIEVIVGVMEKEGMALNHEFFQRVPKHPPFAPEEKSLDKNGKGDQIAHEEGSLCSQA